MISVLSRSFVLVFTEFVSAPNAEAVQVLRRTYEEKRITYPEYVSLLHRFAVDVTEDAYHTDPVFLDCRARWEARGDLFPDVDKVEEACDPEWSAIDAELTALYDTTEAKFLESVGEPLLAEMMRTNRVAFLALRDCGRASLIHDKSVMRASLASAENTLAWAVQVAQKSA